MLYAFFSMYILKVYFKVKKLEQSLRGLTKFCIILNYLFKLYSEKDQEIWAFWGCWITLSPPFCLLFPFLLVATLLNVSYYM